MNWLRGLIDVLRRRRPILRDHGRSIQKQRLERLTADAHVADAQTIIANRRLRAALDQAVHSIRRP